MSVERRQFVRIRKEATSVPLRDFSFGGACIERASGNVLSKIPACVPDRSLHWPKTEFSKQSTMRSLRKDRIFNACYVAVALCISSCLRAFLLFSTNS